MPGPLALLDSLSRNATHVAGNATHAAGNAWSHYVGGGVEPHVPTPSRKVHDEPHAILRRYDAVDVSGDPILLVPPLAVHITCFDLRENQSVAAFLVATGRPVYVVDFGEITFADRTMGFEDWIDRILPATLRRVSARHGGRPVDVVTWSLGGTLMLLTAAAHDDLPLRSIAAVGTPIDYSLIPYVAPLRTIGRVTGGRVLSTAFRTAGGLPGWAVRASFKATALQREITKPWFVLRNLHDAETLGRMEAVDRFIGLMPGYPGRLYGQLYHHIVQGNALADGRLDLGAGRVLELGNVRQDVLVVGGTGDVIAPVACVRRACDVLTGVRSIRFETAPGSHLGVLTGPEAADTTWRHLADFLSAVSGVSAGT
ncbi:MAG: poly[(R)-3-hydroxyalkanoate] polymerase subunit PhaC [Pseudonocardiales bacterium]|nr:poly[(R)-3-hydroxyalkanoate] polymerase subunit PhaC [Pseudonocardiales bacterium]